MQMCMRCLTIVLFCSFISKCNHFFHIFPNAFFLPLQNVLWLRTKITRLSCLHFANPYDLLCSRSWLKLPSESQQFKVEHSLSSTCRTAGAGLLASVSEIKQSTFLKKKSASVAFSDLNENKFRIFTLTVQ